MQTTRHVKICRLRLKFDECASGEQQYQQHKSLSTGGMRELLAAWKPPTANLSFKPSGILSAFVNASDAGILQECAACVNRDTQNPWSDVPYVKTLSNHFWNWGFKNKTKKRAPFSTAAWPGVGMAVWTNYHSTLCSAVVCGTLKYLSTVLGLGNGHEQLHDWLGLGDQWRHDVNNCCKLGEGLNAWREEEHIKVKNESIPRKKWSFKSLSFYTAFHLKKKGLTPPAKERPGNQNKCDWVTRLQWA